MPPWDQTGVPIHFHSSTTLGSACLIKARRWDSISPRQSPSSWILASISRDADSTPWELLFFMVSACFLPELLLFAGFLGDFGWPVRNFDTELLGVLRVEPRPTELHRPTPNEAADGSPAEKAIQNIETNVPPGSTH